MKGRQYDFFEAGFMVLQCGEKQYAAILLQAPTAPAPRTSALTKNDPVVLGRSDPG